MKKAVLKRVSSMFLIMILVLQVLPLNIVAEEIQENETFTDVTSYEKEIYQLVKLGIIKGYPDQTFKPDHSITRAQGVAMIIREMKLDTSNRPNPHFKDIDSKYRFYDEIAAAVDEGIIDGFTDGTFGPDEEMTRSQMAKVLVGAYDIKLKESEIHSFKDVPATHWANNYINVLASTGITNGYNDGTFKPENKLTRLHFSLFLSRYINEIKNEQPDTEVDEIKKRFDLKADKTTVSFGESASLNLQVSGHNEIYYKTDWKATGGKLTVAEEGNSATWKAEQSGAEEYTVTVTIETSLKSGERITFDKTIAISTVSSGESSSGSGGSSGSSTKQPPYQVTVALSKDSYASGEEVVVQGVVQDQKGKSLADTVIKLDGMETTTDKQGNYNFSFLAINETKEYRLYSGETPLKILGTNGDIVETFGITIDNETIDLKPTIIGLNSETMAELIEFTNGEKAVFKGKPEGIEKLSNGSVFVTSPTEEFPLGVSGKVVSIQYEKDKTIILLTEPKLEEVFNKLEVEGTTELSIENIIPEEGVKVYLKENEQEKGMFRASEVFLGDDIEFEFNKDILDVEGEWIYDAPGIEANFTGEAEVDIGGTLELKKTEVEFDISLLEGSGELIFTNEQAFSLGLNGKVNGSGEVSVRIARIFIPIQAPIGIMGSLWVVVGADGNVSFKIGYDQTSELELGTKVSIGDGVDVINDFEVTDSGFTNEVEGEVSIKSGIKPNLFLSVYTTEYIGLDNQIGITGKIEGSIENIGTEDVRRCLATDISLYAQSDGAIKEPIQESLRLLTWEHSLGKTETCPQPKSISIDPKEELVEKGDQIQLKVMGITEDDEERDYTKKKDGTEYETSDSAVATVSKDGLVTVLENAPVGKEFTITAKNNEKEAVATFKVIEIKEVVIAPDILQIPAGGSQRISFNAILTNDEIFPLNNGKLPIEFKVEDTNIASVSEDGVVNVPKEVLRGMTTTVTASFETYEATVLVEVLPAPGSEGNLEIVSTPPIAAGYEHTVYVKDDGTVWTWGKNNKGQLGDGSIQDRYTPTQVLGLSDIIAVAAGTSHSLALSKDGTVWAWGYNVVGQLGNGSSEDSLIPVKVEGIDNAVSIGAGAYTSYAILPDGSVKSWGSGRRGLLGNGVSEDSNVPVDVVDLKGVVSIDSSLNVWSERHTVALKSDGTVWTWGANYFGGLGTGPNLSAVWHDDYSTPVQVAGLNGEGYLQDIVRVQAGDIHTLALGKDGTVYGWGNGWGNEFFDAVNHPVTKTDIDGNILDDVKADFHRRLSRSCNHQK